MSAPLGSFVPKPAATGDMFQASAAIGRPLIVQVVGVDDAVPVAARDGKPASVKGAITVHVWDLVGGFIGKDPTTQAPIQGPPNTVYCNVRWMAVALVDQLKGYLGAAPMPMKVVSGKNKTNEYSSLQPVAIEGPELAQVQQVFAQDPTRIEREAMAKAQAAATQAAAPVYQQSGFTPMQVQPTQMPYQQPQAPAAAQFQAPAGQPGAIAQTPAQVAQQWAPVDQAAQQAYQATQQPWSPPAQMSADYPNAPANVAQVMNGGMQAHAQHHMPAGGQAVGQMPAPAGMQMPQAAPGQMNGQPGGAWQNPGQPQFQQAPAAAQGQLGHVQNSDVANILAGLAANGQQPG
jgi:hypothetical protein